MKKEEFIKKFSKIGDTFEDEFRAEFNSPELIWGALCKTTAISSCDCFLGFLSGPENK